MEVVVVMVIAVMIYTHRGCGGDGDDGDDCNDQNYEYDRVDSDCR